MSGLLPKWYVLWLRKLQGLGPWANKSNCRSTEISYLGKKVYVKRLLSFSFFQFPSYFSLTSLDPINRVASKSLQFRVMIIRSEDAATEQAIAAGMNQLFSQ